MKIHRKISQWIAVIVLLCFLPNTAIAGNRPYVPAAVSSMTAGTYVARQVPNMLANTWNLLANTWNPRHLTGSFGEHFMHNYFNRGLDLASGKHWYSLDPGAVQTVKGEVRLLSEGKEGRQGIDGLLMQFDSRGNPRSLMVSESKFGSSQQGITQTGFQGSKEYNTQRLRAAAQNWQRLAKHISNGNIQRISGEPPRGVKEIKIPLSDKESIAVWWDEGSGKYLYNDSSVTPDKMKSQANKIARYIQGCADGLIDYRSRLFRTRIRDGKLECSIYDLNSNGSKSNRFEHIFKPYEELTAQQRQAIKDAIIGARTEFYMKKSGLNENEALKRATADVKKAEKRGTITELVKDTTKSITFDWKGSTKISLYSGFIAAGFSAVFSIGRNLWNGEQIDYQGVARDSLLGFASASGGVLAGLGMTHIIQKHMVTSSQSLISKMLPKLSGLTGVLVASAIFSYGYALWNTGNLSDGNKMMVTSVAMSGVGWATGQSVGWALSALGIGGKVASVLGFAGPVIAVILAGQLYAKYEEYQENNRRFEHLRTLVYSYD